ncbi:MAG: helix-turn-helix domain-containing protein [Hyphomicrobiaceae bacterium]
MKSNIKKPVDSGAELGGFKEEAPRYDWSAVDALTEEQILAAALADPDAQPLSDAQLQRMKRPNPKVVRRALGLSQAEFAERFKIPIETLRDWEERRVEPDQTARAYLMAIAGNPDAVREALEQWRRFSPASGAEG